MNDSASRRTPIRILSFLAMLAWLGVAAAGGLGVSPIRIHLSDGMPTAAMTLENNSARATVVQLQLLAWEAKGEQDSYQPTEELVASPPIATIQPGETQIVRVGLSRDVDPQRELAYRLYIEEVPPPPKPDQQGLQVALRIGVPVFVEPRKAARPELAWRIERSVAEGLTLHVINNGNAHVRLMSFRLRAADDARLLDQRQIVGYLLPGQSRHWNMRFQQRVPAGRLLLSVTADPGVADVELEPENR